MKGKVLMLFVFTLFTCNLRGEVVTERIGHRGACGYEPENTLRSFQKALNLKVDGIELDVHLCKSGELVVIHDEKVDRTTNGTGLVADLTLQQIKKFDAGKGEAIPTLSEVFDLTNREVKVIIELKAKNTGQAVAKLIDIYVNEKNWQYEDFLVISFDHDEVFSFINCNSKVETGLSFSRLPKMNEEFFEKISNVGYVITSHKKVNENFLNMMHEKNIKVIVYTVNKTKDIYRMKQLRVDGIASDYPDMV